MKLLDPQQQLLIEYACSKLVFQAAAFADAGASKQLAALFTPNGILIRPGGATFAGRQAIEDSYASRPADRLTRHVVTNILVDVQSDTEARALSCVLLWSASAADEPTRFGRPATGPQVVGEFQDSFLFTSEGWRLTHREARFLMHTST